MMLVTKFHKVVDFSNDDIIVRNKLHSLCNIILIQYSLYVPIAYIIPKNLLFFFVKGYWPFGWPKNRKVKGTTLSSHQRLESIFFYSATLGSLDFLVIQSDTNLKIIQRFTCYAA
jgi:hypothetical protein